MFWKRETLNFDIQSQDIRVPEEPIVAAQVHKIQGATHCLTPNLVSRCH